VSIALGSHAELETGIEIARRLGYRSQKEFDELMAAVETAGQLLSGLFRSLVARGAR
jgi:four helix bundle protein